MKYRLLGDVYELGVMGSRVRGQGYDFIVLSY